MANTIKTTHNSAEMRRQDAVDAQENADAWRSGWTSSAGPVVLSQHRAIPDGYHFNFDNLKDSITTAHTTAETARQAAVDAQENADKWRKGSTPNSGTVYPYGLSQRRAIPDGYHFNYDNLETSIKNTHDSAEAARNAAVAAQDAADAWRKGSTPNAGPVLALNQRRAIPDGYHFNYDNLETSI